MSSPEETLLEAKLATIKEPYQKAGINNDSCTVKGVAALFVLMKDFEKIQKFLHHLLKEGIYISSTNGPGF